jgi:hypothetical protein
MHRAYPCSWRGLFNTINWLLQSFYCNLSYLCCMLGMLFGKKSFFSRVRLKKLVKRLEELTDQFQEQEDLEDEDVVPHAYKYSTW